MPELNAQGDENNPGAYIHRNVDNDNLDAVWDYQDYEGGVAGEDDMKQLSISFAPTDLNFGYVTIWRDTGDLQVWRNATKSQPLLTCGPGEPYAYASGNAYWSWDLSNPTSLNDFNSVKNSLWVESVGPGAGHIMVSYSAMPTMGGQACPDYVAYTPIHAYCGHQPSVAEYNFMNTEGYFGGDTGLVDCEWSITSGVFDGTLDPSYNCIDWSIGEYNTWYNPQAIDLKVNGGNGDGVFESTDMTGFYLKKKGWTLCTGQDPAGAKAMYYPYPTNWDFTNYPDNSPSTGFHAAARRNCSCGAGKWVMYESKCGKYGRLEHVWNQLDRVYGAVTKMFYK